ncbi:hypothetical protein Nepgr_015576 [Nepenthes gracilis]|uniref:peptidylprolyl isomerase n=1 Tax=Nepenthes gracilis TaxID=150966 RepID=A0AAD3SN37_NEPGR|nr:hypothetical protein Nepgr_015576 [Nepenthes gracilis]
MTMKKGEVTLLTIAPEYAFSSLGFRHDLAVVPHNSTGYYEVDSFGDKEKKQAEALKITCNLNNAAYKLKLNDYKQAKKLCTKVLELDSQNVKALYKRAQVYINITNLDLAEFDIKKVLEIDPES